MVRLRSVISLALAVAVALAATPADAQQKATLVFSSGPTGGSWIPMAAATADVVRRKFPEIELQVEPGAALVNMEKIRNDKADIGWSMTTVLADARAGTNTWKGKQTDKPLFVANYYPNVWQLVVPVSAKSAVSGPRYQDSRTSRTATSFGRIAFSPRSNPWIGILSRAVVNTATCPRA